MPILERWTDSGECLASAICRTANIEKRDHWWVLGSDTNRPSWATAVYKELAISLDIVAPKSIIDFRFLSVRKIPVIRLISAGPRVVVNKKPITLNPLPIPYSAYPSQCGLPSPLPSSACLS